MEPFWYRVGDGMNRWISLVKTGWGRKTMLTGRQGKGLKDGWSEVRSRFQIVFTTLRYSHIRSPPCHTTRLSCRPHQVEFTDFSFAFTVSWSTSLFFIPKFALESDLVVRLHWQICSRFLPLDLF